jgi:hypothetical protein
MLVIPEASRAGISVVMSTMFACNRRQLSTQCFLSLP